MTPRTIINHLAPLLGAHYRALAKCCSTAQEDILYDDTLREIKRLLDREDKLIMHERVETAIEHFRKLADVDNENVD